MIYKSGKMIMIMLEYVVIWETAKKAVENPNTERRYKGRNYVEVNNYLKNIFSDVKFHNLSIANVVRRSVMSAKRESFER